MSEQQITDMLNAFLKVPFAEASETLNENTISLHDLDKDFLAALFRAGENQNCNDLFASVRGIDPFEDGEMMEQMVQFFGRKQAGMEVLAAEIRQHGRILHLSPERLALLYYCSASYSLKLSAFVCQWTLTSDLAHKEDRLAYAARMREQLHLFEIRYAQMETCHEEQRARG